MKRGFLSSFIFVVVLAATYPTPPLAASEVSQSMFASSL
jgi:hypothetical protein